VILIFFYLFYLQVYKKRTETAKKEYLKALAAYRASLVSQVSVENSIFPGKTVSADGEK
jgi:hypothetical protein